MLPRPAQDVVKDSDGRLSRSVRHFGGIGRQIAAALGHAAVATYCTDGCEGQLPDGSGLTVRPAKARKCEGDGG